MSARYPGGFITKTPTAPTSSAAPGIWTLDQAMQNQKAGNWPFGGPFTYIEDVFSTWLYTGNGSTQTITNGIDLSTKGGLVWIKARNSVNPSTLFDTARGATNYLFTTSTAAQATAANTLTSFNTTGFSLGTDATIGTVNTSSDTYASWTFREQAKFFDIVTYTGNGATQNISHSLGATPGCIIIKATNAADGWRVYHTSTGAGQYGALNGTSAFAASSTIWNNTAPTSTVFSLGAVDEVNRNTTTYVAYLFAHNAGGFGLTGSDNVISCGSFTTDGSGNGSISLGYEPQWLLVKESSGTGNWSLLDNMRGLPAGSFTDALLSANLTTAEAATNVAKINATGASFTNYNPSATVIYIAIRRGPMKVPTLGTSVFTPVTYTGDGSSLRTITTNIVTDMIIGGNRSSFSGPTNDRLRGQVASYTTDTSAELSSSLFPTFDVMDGYINLANGGDFNSTGGSFIRWAFRRAPSFFDEVCVTTSGYAVTATHNLGVSPELIIGKARSQTGSWFVWVSSVAALNVNNLLKLNTTAAATNYGMPINTVTATSFYAAIAGVAVETEVFYLFATCAGVSKVGSYTGTAALLTVNCGFTSGARFVMIKRTDSTGDWYTYDSARGISSGNDPYIFMNSASAAEVTGTNYVDTDTTGFKVTAAAPAGLNANGGTYIFLAIA